MKILNCFLRIEAIGEQVRLDSRNYFDIIHQGNCCWITKLWTEKIGKASPCLIYGAGPMFNDRIDWFESEIVFFFWRVFFKSMELDSLRLYADFILKSRPFRLDLWRNAACFEHTVCKWGNRMRTMRNSWFVSGKGSAQLLLSAAGNLMISSAKVSSLWWSTNGVRGGNGWKQRNKRAGCVHWLLSGDKRDWASETKMKCPCFL